MIAKHEPGKDVVAYFESNQGEFLGRMTRYIDEEEDRREKDAYHLASGNGRWKWLSVYPMDVFFMAGKSLRNNPGNGFEKWGMTLTRFLTFNLVTT